MARRVAAIAHAMPGVNHKPRNTGSGLAACFLGPMALSLYWPRINVQGAMAGMLGGFLTSVVWILFLKSATYELYEIIPGFLVGLTGMISRQALQDAVLDRAPRGTGEMNLKVLARGFAEADAFRQGR